MSTKRNVIVHYHLFKNAGTSIDQLLKMNFGDKWMAYDADSSHDIISCKWLEQLLKDNPEVDAFSSHQIVPPIPDIDANVYPIVILRDPIDRIKSAYLFEWQKQPGLDKPKGTLEDYIKEKFSNKRRNSIEEFQTIRLSNPNQDSFQNFETVEDDVLLDNAKHFIQSLPFVGIVDDFDRTVALLLDYLKPAFPDFVGREVKANVLQDLSLTQEEKRANIKNDLGDELFEEVLARNSMDEALYQIGKAHFEKLYNAMDSDPMAKVA